MQYICTIINLCLMSTPILFLHHLTDNSASNMQEVGKARVRVTCYRAPTRKSSPLNITKPPSSSSCWWARREPGWGRSDSERAATPLSSSQIPELTQKHTALICHISQAPQTQAGASSGLYPSVWKLYSDYRQQHLGGLTPHTNTLHTAQVTHRSDISQ